MRLGRRNRFAVLVSALALLATSACSGADSGDRSEPTPVTVGILPILDVAPLYLGVQEGIFAKHGLKVDVIPAQGGTAIIPAVVAGEAQFGFANPVSLLAARERGVPLVAVAAGSSVAGTPETPNTAVLVGRKSALRRPADLAGKTVAVSSLSNLGDTTIRTAVAKDGGDPTRIRFVEVPFPEMPALLEAGRVDAVWSTEPFVSAIRAKGGRVLFDNMAATHPQLQLAVYFTTADFMASDPGTVRAFVDAMQESLAYASTHGDRARQIVTTYTPIPSAAVGNLSLPTWPSGLDRGSAQALGDAALRFGVLQAAPDIDGLFRPQTD